MTDFRLMCENKGQDFDEVTKTNPELSLPKIVSKTEAIIYDWVYNHFGTNEAMNPSWNITALADELDAKLKDNTYTQEHTVMYYEPNDN